MYLTWPPHEQKLRDPCNLNAFEELMFGNLHNLLIQMDLPSSIWNKNGKTSLHFQSAAFFVRATNVPEMTSNL